VGFGTFPFRFAFAGAGKALTAGLFGLSFLFLACLSRPPVAEPLPVEKPQTRIGSFPEDGWLVFTGVAGIRSRREESINLALEEAAKKISIFERVEGTVSSYSSQGSRFLDYRFETTGSIDYNRDYKAYIEKLEYDPDIDVFQHENTIFVRTRYKGSLPLSYQSPASGSGGKPGWVDDPPPEISGYAVGVGYAGRRDVHRDTVIASYENAIFTMIQNQSSKVWGANTGFQGSGFLDYSAVDQKGTSAEGVLNGFYVLEIWIDPVTRAVWTLAIARSG
jgi:hypothetical protein